MKRVIISAVCAFILVLIQTNFDSAFGFSVTIQFPVICAILACTLALPVVPASISVLCLGLVCDLMSSGPQGIYALSLGIVYVIAFVILNRLRTERVISLMFYVALGCILFDALQATGYSAVYRSLQYWRIFAHHFVWDALITALFTPIMMYLVRILESFLDRKHSARFI